MKSDNIYVYSVELPRERGFELVIAGGGIAGSTAAITAGRLGLKVLLLEGTGSAGGMATNGLVTAFDGMGDGEHNIVGGIMLEIVERLYKAGGLAKEIDTDRWRKYMYKPTRFNPESLKRVLDKLIMEAGVTIRYFTHAIDVDADRTIGNIKGIIVKQAEGLRYIETPFFIDATGNAGIAMKAGAECRIAGIDTQQIMPASLCWISANLDRYKEAIVKIDASVAAGEFPFPDYFAVPSYLGDGIVSFNAGHIYNLNSTDTSALSMAMMKGREIAGFYTDWWKKYAPGAEDMSVVSTASLMGVRESRAVTGEYTMTHADFRHRRHFPDQIGVFNKEIDIHVYNSDAESLKENKNRLTDRFNKDYWMSEGETYGIPYGAIVPVGWKNMWVPGRAISSDVTMHGSVRVMPACAMSGQASGAAAAQCAYRSQAADELDTAPLVSTLRKLGAYLPQPELSSEMTRSRPPE